MTKKTEKIMTQIKKLNVSELLALMVYVDAHVNELMWKDMKTLQKCIVKNKPKKRR